LPRSATSPPTRYVDSGLTSNRKKKGEGNIKSSQKAAVDAVKDVTQSRASGQPSIIIDEVLGFGGVAATRRATRTNRAGVMRPVSNEGMTADKPGGLSPNVAVSGRRRSPVFRNMPVNE
jgi:hypothetical protein